MATVRRTEGMEVPTGGKRSTWFCDVCKAETSTGTWKAHDGTEGHWCYACDQKGRKSTLRTILVDDTRFERGTVEVLCCKSWLLCSGLTTTCHSCGQDYNRAGQQPAPRSQWGEETGECAADLLNLDKCPHEEA